MSNLKVDSVRSTTSIHTAHLQHDPELLAMLKKKQKAVETQAAMASYYTDRLISPAPQDLLKETNRLAAASTAKEGVKGKSFFQKVSDWFAGLFGTAKTEENKVDVPESTEEPLNWLNSAPQLEDAIKAEKKLRESFKKLNAEIKRYEEESADFEKQILLKSAEEKTKLLLEMSQKQKEHKTLMTLLHQDAVKEHHERNKKLWKIHFNLQEEVDKHVKTSNTLKWINVGQTAAWILLMAGTFATGGATAAVGAIGGILGVSSGILKITQGYSKYQGDKKTGDIGVVKNERKNNSSKITDNVASIGIVDQEMSRLWKLLRNHLKNERDAMKFFSRVN